VPVLSCALHLGDVILGDVNALPIPHTDVDGVYQNIFVIPRPYYSMATQGPGASGVNYVAHSAGEVFNVTVSINQVDAGSKIVGYEFKLGYNSSLLKILNVVEGPFLPPFAVSPDQGTSFLTAYGFNATINQDYVQVGDVVLPNTTGQWTPPFPSGAGVLAIITFNCSLQNPFGGLDLTCPLTLFDTIIANTTAAVLPQDHAPVSGTYTMKAATPVVSGRVIDIFTGWPAPYGGQGYMQPSDMFWPQKSVSLFANVTLNGYPEQGKDVAFQVIAPNNQLGYNQTWAILYARTNTNGIAEVDFRLPWPCPTNTSTPEQWFGVWTVVGTVDIDCVIVNDTLWFHYDYLVHIFKQTTDIVPPAGYDHAQYINVTVYYGTYLQQTDAVYFDEISGTSINLSNVTIVLTAFDNVSVPFGLIDAQIQFANPISGNSTANTIFGGAPRDLTGPSDKVFSNYINYTASLLVYIPKWAAAGPGEIDCAALNNWPYFGGTILSGYQVDTLHWLPYAPTPIYITNKIIT
jgi:hypothetical protein